MKLMFDDEMEEAICLHLAIFYVSYMSLVVYMLDTIKLKKTSREDLKGDLLIV